MSDEFDPAGTIAMFIASALQHPRPPCNGRSSRVSTIRVEQHKNKFNNVIVYCELANANLVSEAWAEEGNSGPPPGEFINKCRLHDARLYRSVYHKMLFLAPGYREMMFNWADYGYLLFDGVVDLEAWLDAKGEHALETNGQHLMKPHVGWRAGSLDDLREKLRRVYD